MTMVSLLQLSGGLVVNVTCAWHTFSVPTVGSFLSALYIDLLGPRSQFHHDILDRVIA